MQIVINVDNELHEYFSMHRSMQDDGYFSHVGQLIEAFRGGSLEQEPCGDCISRQAVLDALESIGSLDTEADKKYARSVFEALPSVNSQELKTGRWKDCGEREPWYRCSECGQRVWGGHKKYCSNCGLRMLKPYESEDK